MTVAPRLQVTIVDPSSFTRPYDHELCNALVDGGVDAALVTSRFDYTSAPANPRYPVRNLFYRAQPGSPGSRQRRLAKAVQHPVDMLRLRRHVRDADVVHFQWLNYEPVDRLLMPKGVPLVFTAHNTMPRDAMLGQHSGFRHMLEEVDAIVVHAEFSKQRLVDRLGVPSEKIEVIPHGAFTYLQAQPVEKPLPPELAEDDGPIVLMLGLLRPHKGLEVLLEAWRGVEGAKLWVVGDPRYDISAHLRHPPANTRFVPRFIDDSEMPAIFRRADLVVLPYREIDQSGVVFAALAFGKPLVLTSVGGFPDIAALGAAQLVPPEDGEALREAIMALVHDPHRRAEMAKAAEIAAETTLSWERIARQTKRLYERVAA